MNLITESYKNRIKELAGILKENSPNIPPNKVNYLEKLKTINNLDADAIIVSYGYLVRDASEIIRPLKKMGIPFYTSKNIAKDSMGRTDDGIIIYVLDKEIPSDNARKLVLRTQERYTV